jgi:hypothetical protein
MALPNDSVQQAEGAGATIATHLISSKEHHVSLEAGPSGHIRGTVPGYYLYQTPRATTTTATDYFDLFNPTGSGKVVTLRGMYSVVQQVGTGNSAVTSWGWSAIRTSAAGTGGTAFTYNSAAPTTTQGDIVVMPIDTTSATVSGVLTGRGVPTGGATAAQFLFSFELNAALANASSNMGQGINWIPEFPDYQSIVLQENQGLKIRQNTATASGTTNAARFGFILAFTVR